jgi:predicted molibdopterin-dependent oxidoreductase YjgC
MPDAITLTVDGTPVTAKPGQTVIQAAMDAGIYIPYLCYWPGMKPYGACRMCVVEVDGQRGTPASCTLPAANGMAVKTTTPLIQKLRRGILELLLSEHPHGCLTCHRIELCGPEDVCLRHVRVTDRCVVCPKNERCELKDTVRFVGMNLESPLSYNYRNLPVETADPFYDRDLNLCIVCARCVRVCEEVRADDAIGMVDRSGTALVGTSRGTSLLESGCEFCGACIDVCPVGALVERDYKWEKAVKSVTTTCTHCAVGCQVKLEVDARGRVIRSVGDWTAPANAGQLCFKGKFGMGFVNHKGRLKKPLIRRDGGLHEASWEEALALVASKLPQYRGDAFAMLVSPRASTEEAYLAQKFARAVMGTNNVDVTSNTRPEQVLALQASLGVMAATGTLQELERAGCVLVVNSNTTEEHNVAAVPLKKGRKTGTLKLVVIDAREVELTRHADMWLRPYPGTEVALVAGILRAIRNESLENKEFLAASCQGWEALSQALDRVDLARVAEVTGVPQEAVRRAARLFATQRPGAILYALDNVPTEQRTPLVQALVDLALVTGNVGAPSSGLFPLRMGANEQGAWDVGCVPGFLPGYVSVADSQGRATVEQAWGTKLPAGPGLGVREVEGALRDGRLKALYVMGDSSTFDVNSLDALEGAEFLVVHDLFLSEVARRAHVVLPLTAFAEQEGTYTSLDRRVQLLRPVVAPKGEAKPLAWALGELARRLGAPGFEAAGPAAVMREIASIVPFYRGITHKRLQQGGIQWPCASADDPGTPRLQPGGTGPGKAHLAVFDPAAAARAPVRELPFLYAPGRVLAQPEKEVGVVRGNGRNAIRREEAVVVHPEDARALGISPGDAVEVVTPAYRVRGRARVTGSLRGVVSTTRLFGELATALDASGEPDPMLRVPALDILPSRLEKLVAGP